MHSAVVKTGLVLCFCFGVLASAHAACIAPPLLKAKIATHPDANTYAELGTWFSDHHRHDCAIDAYRTGLNLEPDSPRLYYLIGLSLYFSGHADEAVGSLQKSIELRPDSIKAHLILAAALEQLKRSQEARAEWEAALKIDPHSAIALDGLSKNLIANADYFPVIQLLHSAPPDENLSIDLAQALGRAGMLDDATETLTKASAALPSSLRLSNALITLLISEIRFSDAVHEAEKALRLHPRDLDAQKLYLHALVLADDTTLARPLARKLLTAAPHDFDVLYLNGVLERTMGQNEAARSHLVEAVALNPRHYNALYSLGLVLSELGDAHGAREQFEKALTFGADEPEIRFKLAAVLRTLGETQLADEQLKLYQQEMQAKTNRGIAANRSALAAKALDRGDVQKAISLYREAVAASPKDTMLGYRLALALDQTGDTGSERAELERVVQLDPDFALAQNQLGYICSRSGDSACAEEHFRAAVHAAPAYVQAWISLAATLGMVSRFPEAKEAVASALKLDPNNADALQLQKDLTAAEAQH